jgi:ribonuclease D
MHSPADPSSAPDPSRISPFRWVASQADLVPLLTAARAHPSVALDTEADSLHHYHEKVCLIQLAVDGGHWIVNPLAEGLDLQPLMRLLEHRPLILHGADYDLRLLRRAYDFRPRRVLDTMLAAQLLGWREIGLAALVERICGVALSKHGQRADWSVRPLTDRLLAYAVDDTRYLHRLAETLRNELERRGRLAWLEESCERLLETTGAEDPAPPPDENAWRIKGGRHLTDRPAALLRELWRWREGIARRIDRPPFRVAANAFLLTWADWLSEHPEATAAQMPERPAWLRDRRRQSFEHAVQRALALPPEQWPGPPEIHRRQRRFTAEEENLLGRLLRARDAVAERLDLQPGVLGPRDALRPLVRARPADVETLRELTGLMRWQAECLAPAILPLLGRLPRAELHPVS